MPGYTHAEFKAYLEKLISSLGLESFARILPFQQRIAALTKQADAILVCSRMEAFGRVCLEAMQLRKPVIATASGGNLEMIQDGETGLLYPIGDIPALADRIERLMKDPGLRARLGESGFRFVNTQFSEERFGGRISEIMRGLPERKIAWNAELDEALEALTGREFAGFVRRAIAVNKALKKPLEIR